MTAINGQLAELHSGLARIDAELRVATVNTESDARYRALMAPFAAAAHACISAAKVSSQQPLLHPLYRYGLKLRPIFDGCGAVQRHGLKTNAIPDETHQMAL